MIPEWAIEIAIGLYHCHADGRHSGNPTRDQIAAALVDVDRRARDECTKIVRDGCGACNGTGNGPDGEHEHYSEDGEYQGTEYFPTECEYCGRSMAAMRASTPASAGKEVKGDES